MKEHAPQKEMNVRENPRRSAVSETLRPARLAPTTMPRSKSSASRMNDVMCLCHKISSQIKLAVKYSKRGALVAAGGAFLGGLLGGPLGTAVGGTAGSLLGAWMIRGQFRSLPQIMMELTPAQQQQLYYQVNAVLNNLDWTNAAQLIDLVMKNDTLQQMVTAALLKYVTKELGVKVQN